jgi:diguanylate cyclase (GGDEF)-like protein/PAS domain S-box-containing protein
VADIQDRTATDLGGAPLMLGLPDQLSFLEAIASRGRAAAVWQAVPGEDGIRLVWANDGYCDLLRYTLPDLLGTKAGVHMAPDERREVVRRVANTVLDGGTAYEEVELRRQDGTTVTVAGTYFAVLGGDAPSLVATYHDLTDRDRARRTEAWAETILQRGHDILLVTDAAGVATFVSASVTDTLGYQPDELAGTNVFDLVHPEDLDRAASDFADTLGGEAEGNPTMLRARAADGRWLHLLVQGSNLLDDPSVGGLLLTIRDVTVQHQAQQLAAEHAELLEGVARGMPLEATLFRLAKLLERHLARSRCTVGTVDADGVIRVVVAPSLDRDLVRSVDEVKPDSDLGQALRVAGAEPVFFEDIVGDRRWGALGTAFEGHGVRACWVMRVISPGSGELLGNIGVYCPEARLPTDDEHLLLERATSLAAVAIERREFESALEHQALHDELTGLPNRTLLIDRIEQALARSRRLGTRLAVLFLDLDGFKLINDSLGHAAGDQLLCQVAGRFGEAVREGDTVGRFGGDEFLVLCEDIEGEAGAIAVADRLADALREPLQVADSEAFVRASIGVALSDEDDTTTTGESLVRNADVAMYRAKAQGRDRTALFEEDLHRQVVERLDLERDLHRAVHEGQLVLHYQPIVRLSDSKVVAVEALVRWERPGRGLVAPSDFIPMAEETGLIIPIGRWVIQQACRQARRWADLPGGPLEMTINLSGRQLAKPDFATELELIVAAAGVDPALLCFEVTESTLADEEGVAGSIARIKALGAQVAIDDFGTGYATLEHVRRFSTADQLKIDRSFVAGIQDVRSPDVAIVSAAIVLANALGFTVVAEGVETEVQLGVLRGLGCDRAQGYLFSKPVRARELNSSLRDGSRS